MSAAESALAIARSCSESGAKDGVLDFEVSHMGSVQCAKRLPREPPLRALRVFTRVPCCRVVLVSGTLAPIQWPSVAEQLLKRY